jgi:secernin
VLFGKNSDREYNESQYLEQIPATKYGAGEFVQLTYCSVEQVRETRSVLLSKPHWIWGAEIGANAAGLVIGNEAIFSTVAAEATAGIIGMDYLRLALERASCVDEGIEVITQLLQQHGQSGNCGYRRELTYHNSYLLADLKVAKVLETVDRDWVVMNIADHGAISNAITTIGAPDEASAGWRVRSTRVVTDRKDRPLSFRDTYQDFSKTQSGDFRQMQAMQRLGKKAGDLTETDFFDILRDHREGPAEEGRPPPRICTHAAQNALGQTTASWVASLGNNRMVHWVTGTAAPCTSVFKPVVVRLGLPEHGPHPGTHADHASLWWRHEKFRLQHDQAPKELRDQYSAERDALERRFVTELESSPDDAIEGQNSEMSRIITRTWSDALAFETRWLSNFQNV